jgi:lipid-A-disaccharide synthase
MFARAFEGARVKPGREVMLVVGEASGDMHGAQLVRALLTRDATIKVFGVGGEQLRQTEFEILFNVSEITGMGLMELIGNLKRIRDAYRLLRTALRTRRPGLLVLIDFPDFNLRLAKYAKTLGIPVLFYVSPQVWAWRRGRVRQIARWVDQMAVVFPFEQAFYEEKGVNVQFVGHPLLDTVRAKEGRESVLAKLGLDPSKPTVALLPGSRRKEVGFHLPVMVDAAERLSQMRAIQFLCVRASTVGRAELEDRLRSVPLQIPLVEKDRYEAVAASDLVWTASGTATLETALLLRPMIIVYRLSWLTYVLARFLVRVQHIGIVNLIAGERIVPELIQSEFNVPRIIKESEIILDDRSMRESIVLQLSKLRKQLGKPGASDRVAALALSMIGSS